MTFLIAPYDHQSCSDKNQNEARTKKNNNKRREVEEYKIKWCTGNQA